MLHGSEATTEGNLMHFAQLEDVEPINHEDSLKEDAWKQVMIEELKAIKRNNTWQFPKLPPNKKAIDVKWVFKLKLNLGGSIARHKVKNEFEMIDLGKLAYFLGMEFVTVPSGIILDQKKYAMDVLKRFNMNDCKPSITLVEVGLKLDNTSEDDELVDPTLFKQLVGSLRYLCNSRPYISFAVGLVSRFMVEPRKLINTLTYPLT